ncbi:MAG TPA: ABC transporter ATP-binding protein, partial [Polyangiaceae bacterium]|nr:ABC transporter ATP-binding protein [Polyangiaceae bacterium]
DARRGTVEAEPEDDGRQSVVEVLGPSRTDTRQRRHALLYVQRLSKVYATPRGWFREPELVQAVDGVSFYVRHRETFGLIGASGSGKSTLGRCILRLTEPTVGRVIFDGKDVTSMRPAELRATRQRMQIVFQNPFTSLNPNMTAGEIVREGMDVFDLAESRHEREDKARRLLERVGLDRRAESRYPHEFSGGQRQRIAIARALAVEPDFIVLDEPTSALDLSVQAQILNLLQDLQEELGLSQLFISHDLRVVQYVAHRIAVMYRGRIIELGPSDALVKRRHHPYTRALFDAMPRTMDRDGRRSLQLVTDPDGSRSPPKHGCPYVHHCPNAEPGMCDESQPRLEEVIKGSHHRVACWHPNMDG